ncbi:MAG: hypothetical protein P4L26_07895, partial [Terracidiphilus sp.]|nr:hypothetical protein [Terracidiphilus sp.]
LNSRCSPGYSAAMKSWISTIFTLAGMGVWWLYAADSDLSSIAGVLGLLAIGILMPLAIGQMIPKER